MAGRGPSQQHAESNRFEHTVQFFDGPESLGEAVARFFATALAAGDRLLMLAKPLHVEAITGALAQRDHGLTTLVESGRLVMLDAATTLRLIMKRGTPNLDALWTVAENAIDHLAPDHQRVAIYGELVEILAEEGNFRGAEQVEAFWNEFGAKHPISLFCGYSSAHFVMPESLAALNRICTLHGQVLHSRHDLLANWLLSKREATSPTA